MIKIFRILVLMLLVTSCNAPQAVYDYDQTVEFDQYRTYAIYQDLQTGLNQLDEGRLINSLNQAMMEKGFSQAENTNLQVNVYTQEYQRDNRSRVGLGLGGGGGNVGVGISGGIPVGKMDNYMKITFDFVDIEKDELVWQATVESSFNKNARPEKRQQRFAEVVEEALKNYPPKK